MTIVPLRRVSPPSGKKVKRESESEKKSRKYRREDGKLAKKWENGRQGTARERERKRERAQGRKKEMQSILERDVA